MLIALPFEPASTMSLMLLSFRNAFRTALPDAVVALFNSWFTYGEQNMNRYRIEKVPSEYVTTLSHATSRVTGLVEGGEGVGDYERDVVRDMAKWSATPGSNAMKVGEQGRGAAKSEENGA